MLTELVSKIGLNSRARFKDALANEPLAITSPILAAGFDNVPFDEIEIGQSASMSRQLSMDDIALFATVSGNSNPVHL